MQIEKINQVQPLVRAAFKNDNTEVFYTVSGQVDFDEWVLVLEVAAITATGVLTLNVYTNQTGGNLWETVKASAVSLSAAGVATYTFPDPTTKKLPANVIRIGAAGTNLAGPAPGPEVSVTFSIYLVERAG